MTTTQPLAARRVVSRRRVSWLAAGAVAACNVAVMASSPHPMAHSSWLATVLVGTVLAAVAPRRRLPLVQALIRGGLLTLPVFFALVFIFDAWLAWW